MNRPLSTRLSLALAPTRTNPDLVSFASFALALLSAWLLARRVSVGGAIAVQAASVLDGVDGELARLQLRSTAAGALLDGILDRLGDASIVAGMAIWALREAGDPAGVVALAVAATTGSMLSMASKDRIAALGMASPHERVLGWLLGGRDGRLLIAALAAVTGRPAIGLIAIVASSGLTLVLRMSSARKSGSTLA